CTGKVRDIVKLRVKNQSIERESQTAEDRESFAKRLIAEQPGRCRIGRIEEWSIGIPRRGIANAAESIAGGTHKRGQPRLGAASPRWPTLRARSATRPAAPLVLRQYPLAHIAAIPFTNSVTPTGRISTGPASRYIELACTNTVATMLWPVRVSARKSSSM